MDLRDSSELWFPAGLIDRDELPSRQAKAQLSSAQQVVHVNE